MRKRWYILFVARDAEGQLRKIPIPVHYLYVFLAGALIGMFTVTGMAGSYARMLWKVERFNDLRAEKEQIRRDYSQLEQVSHEKDVQVASLGSIAGEVSAIYGLKTDARLLPTNDDVQPGQYQASLDTLYALRRSALTGAAAAGLQDGTQPPSRLALRLGQRRRCAHRCGPSRAASPAPSASGSIPSTEKARSIAASISRSPTALPSMPPPMASSSLPTS